MSSLNAFLNPVYTEKKIEIIVGDRFVDEEGKPIPIQMKSLTQAQLDAIAQQSTKQKKIDGKTVYAIDAKENLNRCLIASITFPDLMNTELCNRYGTLDPVKLPPLLFLPGEYKILAKAFSKLNGLGSDDEEDSDVPTPSGEVTKN